jgi:hypothetical protein
MASLKQSTAYTRTFLMVLASDHITGATGKTVTVNLSKAGGSFGAAGGTVSEVANGWYKIVLNTTDTGTLGDLAFHCTASACDDTDFCDQVSALVLGDVATPTNITAGTITTVTNLTNAPTNGDLTATMKTSVTTAATAATPTAAAVTARVTANTDQLAGQTVTAAAGVTFPASVASPTNITAGTITTVTNLTNAPTNGDLTNTMKTSVTTAATAATPIAASVAGAVGSVTGAVGSVTGAVGSVTGNVGGNVVGSVGSLATAAANTVQTRAEAALATYGAIP